MILHRHVLILILIASFVDESLGKQTAGLKTPTFGKRYHAKGSVQLPYAELIEPFEIYYDGDTLKGRIDIYGGLDKMFYRGDEKPHGNLYEISPFVAAKNTTTPITACFKSPGDNENPVLPQSFLPDLKDFKYNGKKIVDGKVTEEWMKVTIPFEPKVNKYMLYVSRSTSVIPVRYVMMGYDNLIGSHYDKYIIDYDMFDDTTKFNDSVFVRPKTLKCIEPDNDDVEIAIRMNPYQELINPEKGDRYHQMFNNFKAKHGKKYANGTEHDQRKVQFMHNVRFIHSINRQGRSYTLAVNHLADHYDSELRMMNGRRHTEGNNGGKPFPSADFNNADIPDFVDWRLQGAVSQVKDQATCGSCWSFGAAEAIEGAYFLKKGYIKRFSQQNLMDCSWPYGNYGCNGGLASQSYQWVIDNKGLMTEEDYGPYLGQDGKCHYDPTKASVQLSGYVNVTSGNMTALKIALARKGPVAIGIDASLKVFSFYASGVFYDKDCGNTPDDLDHAVLAVGYGSMKVDNKTTDYWIIKNSWSTYWGNNGYVLISQQDNNCGVATAATYVEIA